MSEPIFSDERVVDVESTDYYKKLQLELRRKRDQAKQAKEKESKSAIEKQAEVNTTQVQSQATAQHKSQTKYDEFVPKDKVSVSTMN